MHCKMQSMMWSNIAYYTKLKLSRIKNLFFQTTYLGQIILLKIRRFKFSSCPLWCLLSPLSVPYPGKQYIFSPCWINFVNKFSLCFWFVLCLSDWLQLYATVLSGISTSCDKTYLVTNYKLKWHHFQTKWSEIVVQYIPECS